MPAAAPPELLDRHQLRAFRDLVADGVEHLGDLAVGGAEMVCSIFMASMTSSGWPFSTCRRP